MPTKTITLTQEQIDILFESLHEMNNEDRDAVREYRDDKELVKELWTGIRAREDIMYALTSAK